MHAHNACWHQTLTHPGGAQHWLAKLGFTVGDRPYASSVACKRMLTYRQRAFTLQPSVLQLPMSAGPKQSPHTSHSEAEPGTASLSSCCASLCSADAACCCAAAPHTASATALAFGSGNALDVFPAIPCAAKSHGF